MAHKLLRSVAMTPHHRQAIKSSSANIDQEGLPLIQGCVGWRIVETRLLNTDREDRATGTIRTQNSQMGLASCWCGEARYVLRYQETCREQSNPIQHETDHY